jgi:hypothetical protein
MVERFHTIRAEGIALTIDLAVGHLRALEIEASGRRLTPLYTAPWVDDPAIAGDETIPPNLRALSGDFFCAPFGGADDEGVPPHGWPANSRWEHLETSPLPAGGALARYELQKRPRGARLIKEIALRDGQPFVYQRHVFEGGSGTISVASHAMTKFATRGRLAFSAKAYAATPAQPLESDPARGRYALAYPARFTDLDQAPLREGGTTDLRSYPIAARHEDFVMLVEAPGNRLGWAAAIREDSQDVLLSLKNPRDLPVTMLWFSNGGRDYRPWSGRNVGVLGIEEGRAYSAHGFAASAAPNPLSQSGVPTVLELRPDGTAEVRHVIGGLSLPESFTEITSVETDGDTLRLGSSSGASLSVPFDAAFLNDRSHAGR